MVHEKILERVKNFLIEEYSPFAIGVFGSGKKEINQNSDIDMYVLKNSFSRIVKRESGFIFEIYFGEPKTLSKAIASRNVRIIDRFRNSKIIYDPHNIYLNLIEQAKKQQLAEERWREKTIIGGDYDLIERTSLNIKKSLKEGKLESAVTSLQYLLWRITDLGFKRLNISEYANPGKIPELISILPKETGKLYRQVMFSDIRNKNKIKEIIKQIKEQKEKLLPLI